MAPQVIDRYLGLCFQWATLASQKAASLPPHPTVPCHALTLGPGHNPLVLFPCTSRNTVTRTHVLSVYRIWEPHH